MPHAVNRTAPTLPAPSADRPIRLVCRGDIDAAFEAARLRIATDGWQLVAVRPGSVVVARRYFGRWSVVELLPGGPYQVLSRMVTR